MIDAPAASSVVLLHLSGASSQAQQLLEEDGLWVTPCYDVASARHRLRSLRPDLLVIEVDGRSASDWEVVDTLARDGPPTLVLVPDQSPELRLAALASGAADALARPFHPLELLARVRALARRGRAPEGGVPVLRHADLELDLEGHVATLRGEVLPLTPLEFRLLRTLLEHPQRTFTREELLTRVHVFDDVLPSDRSVDLHVAELRRKLGDLPGTPRYVETVRGRGYRLARDARRPTPHGEWPPGSELAGRGALVFGSGQGFGRALADALAAAGASVVIAAPDGSVTVPAERVATLACRPAHPEEVREAVRRAAERLGGVDILVWTGVLVAPPSIQEAEDAWWQHALALALAGPAQAVRAAVPGMLARGWGRIMLLLAAPAWNDLERRAGGAALIAAVEGLTRGLARELQDTGITANTVRVRPGGSDGASVGIAAAGRVVQLLAGSVGASVSGQTLDLGVPGGL